MKISISKENFDESLKILSKEYKIYAPKVFKMAGTFSDTDLIKYSEVSSVKEMAFEEKSNFSPKEVTLPITQILFHFNEKEFSVPVEEGKGIIVFLRACDMHAVKRVDAIYLQNKYEDFYYKRVRDRLKFVVVGCSKSYDSCFCVSMDSNKYEDYQMGMNFRENELLLDIKDDVFNIFEGNPKDFEMDFVTKNEIKVEVPENIQLKDVIDLEMWREYDSRCIACGKCNFVCPTCTCFSTQDIAYSDNGRVGERRRVWASCHVDGFTDMAGGHNFRQKHGDRMRFKVMHKISDFKKRFGYHMCVGCGRCDDACPEYISFSNCINKLNKTLKGGNINE